MTADPKKDQLRAEIIQDPFRHYDSPMDVVRDDMLTTAQKIQVLKAMEHDARELDVATEENMGGGESHALSDVIEALRAVSPQDSVAGNATGPSKQ